MDGHAPPAHARVQEPKATPPPNPPTITATRMSLVRTWGWLAHAMRDRQTDIPSHLNEPGECLPAGNGNPTLRRHEGVSRGTFLARADPGPDSRPGRAPGHREADHGLCRIRSHRSQPPDRQPGTRHAAVAPAAGGRQGH